MISKPRPKPTPPPILPMHIEYMDVPVSRIVVGSVRVTIGPRDGSGLTRIGQIIRYTAPAPANVKTPYTDLHLHWPTAWPTAISSQMNIATEAHIVKTWMAFRKFYLYARGGIK